MCCGDGDVIISLAYCDFPNSIELLRVGSGWVPGRLRVDSRPAPGGLLLCMYVLINSPYLLFIS
jgi:hypothetical protein